MKARESASGTIHRKTGRNCDGEPVKHCMCSDTSGCDSWLGVTYHPALKTRPSNAVLWRQVSRQDVQSAFKLRASIGRIV